MLTTSAAFRMISVDLDRSLARTAASPQVERGAAYYLANIGKARSVEAFLDDDRLFRFAMKAFGLEDMTYAKGFMRKVLEGGIDKPDSLANRLADTRYREFATAFNFARYGETATVFDRAQQGTVDRYVRQALEEDAGRGNEGVRLALYFQRKAAGLRGPMDVLADPALLKVVQTATGLSPMTAAADVDKQAAMISARLDVAELREPDGLAKFLTRFTAMWELENRPAPAVAPSVLIGQPREFGLSPDLLGALQTLRLGGI